MIEKVNPDHPDKVADRIAGALVDMAYAKQDNPRIAVEVLLGHGECNIIAETSAKLSVRDVWNAVWRITGNDEITVRYREYQQDEHLAENQSDEFQCSVHGVFDCEDAADDYAFQLSKEDGTRAYGALRCPKVGENL